MTIKTSLSFKDICNTAAVFRETHSLDTLTNYMHDFLHSVTGIGTSIEEEGRIAEIEAAWNLLTKLYHKDARVFASNLDAFKTRVRVRRSYDHSMQVSDAVLDACTYVFVTFRDWTLAGKGILSYSKPDIDLVCAGVGADPKSVRDPEYAKEVADFTDEFNARMEALIARLDTP